MSAQEFTVQVYVAPMDQTLTVVAFSDDKVRGILEAIGLIIGVNDVDTFLDIKGGNILLNKNKLISSYPEYIFDGAYLEAF